MKIAIIGRTEILYDTALIMREAGYDIVCILTAKEAPEYNRTAQDFRALAEQWQIPFAQGPRINEFTDFLRVWGADLAVSINYTGVVPLPVIDLFPLGVLNAHGGDLSRYRGNACQAWAILNGEEHFGLCIHKMIGEELDSGDIMRLINACNKPYAGAFCEFEGEKMIIWDAELVEEEENFCAAPGQVTAIGGGFIEVDCWSSKLRVRSVEHQGAVTKPNSVIKSIHKRLT